RPPGEALRVTAATSGQAVFVSGLTVLIAMAGMLLAGNPVFTSIGIGTMIMISVAIVGSLTILPALLSKLEDRVDRGRIPFVARLASADGESRFWGAIVTRVTRRPLVSLLAATAARSDLALQLLRGTLIPETLGKLPGVTVAVTGITAGTKDFNDQMKSRAPVIFAFVLGLAFCLLLLTFRSIVIPIKAILLNLISVFASYGAVVLIFQHRWAEGILGFRSNGAVVSWLPMFLFVVLFALSMDYHLFILSRAK